jgi:hypothetical protein
VVVWAALAIALGLALLSIRSMAHAFGASVGPASSVPVRRVATTTDESAHADRYGRRQMWMMVVEIAFSAGITLLIVSLAYATAMPGRLLVGALLAQLAVVGSLLAPVQVYNVGRVGVRPAAIALGIAQLAHAAFFIRAIQALLG